MPKIMRKTSLKIQMLAGNSFISRPDSDSQEKLTLTKTANSCSVFTNQNGKFMFGFTNQNGKFMLGFHPKPKRLNHVWFITY